MAVLEALASATAVLLSPGCHFPEVETAGVGSIVPSDPEALAEGLAALLTNPETLRVMGDRARDYVARNFSWDQIVDQLLDIYSEGIEGNKIRRNE